MTTIYDLPHELLENILLQTDVESLTRCRQVSRSFNEIITSSSMIQYRIELAMDGFEDNPEGRPDWSVQERLEALRSRRSGWKTMQPTYRRVVTSVRWSLEQHSVLYRFATRSHFAWLENPEDECIHVLQVPSVSRGIPEREWVVNLEGYMLGAGGEYMTMESDEDLLVVTDLGEEERAIVLLSLTTGEYHPEAQSPILSFWRSAEQCLNVCGDYLCVGIILEHDDTACEDSYIYNWKTGVLLLFLPGRNRNDLAFAPDQHLLVMHTNHTESKRSVILAFHLPSLPPLDLDSIEILRLGGVELQLPSDFHPLNVEASPSPQSRGPQSLDNSSAFHPKRHHRDESGVVVLHPYYNKKYKDRNTDTMILPWSAFLSGNKIAQDTGKKALEWEEWGHQVARRVPGSDKELESLWTVDGACTYLQGKSVESAVESGLDELKSLIRRAELAVLEEEEEIDRNVLLLGDDCVIISEVPSAHSQEGDWTQQRDHILSF
ncbi:hypothetical protein BXZ70DRAFT_945409 [Cristinia sonorae]|uniref:F-box domain-containing protein n=1 Tax=Cristinia sonorae TaxID=1940300 RepID=A0A8K0XNA1_9AGAR|nr:hypothetical protein BXZ70DRAFT_945409 [Cristinia sonorae]